MTEHRPDLDSPFDIVIASWSRRFTWEEQRERVGEYEEAGATWYQVALSATDEVEQVKDVIRRGPPRP